MQIHEVFYYPKKGVSNRNVIVARLPLPDTNRSQALRALYPHHKIGSIRPIQPLRDHGQYTYWWLSFDYPGPTVNIPTEDERTQAASQALSDAERSVDYALTKLGIEHRHSYSWPDGSVVYAIRLTPEKDISSVVEQINSTMRQLEEDPITLRWSFCYDKKRTFRKIKFGAQRVTVESFGQIESPWESDPHKVGALNWVDFFEKEFRWRLLKDSGEQHGNLVHRAFRAGIEEAFGHQRLFHYQVRPTEIALRNGAQPASEEECTAYVGAYALGKVLLTLNLPDGAAQKPWRLLYDEGEPKP
jgi:hypothetical protein